MCFLIFVCPAIILVLSAKLHGITVLMLIADKSQLVVGRRLFDMRLKTHNRDVLVRERKCDVMWRLLPSKSYVTLKGRCGIVGPRGVELVLSLALALALVLAPVLVLVGFCRPSLQIPKRKRGLSICFPPR